MAEYSADYTARYRVTYTAGGREHTQTWRVAGPDIEPGDLAALQSFVTAYWDFWAPSLSQDFGLVTVDYARRGEKFFIPVAPALYPLVPVSGDLNANTITSGAVPAFVRLSHRTSLGNAGSVVQYGTTVNPAVTVTNDYRLTSVELPLLADVVTLLNSQPLIVGADNTGVVWRPTANYGLNSGWQRRIRRG